jgi:hypothetical protein
MFCEGFILSVMSFQRSIVGLFLLQIQNQAILGVFVDKNQDYSAHSTKSY